MAASPSHVLKPAVTWISDREKRLMVRVNRWRPPKFMRLWMVAATRGGDGWLWYGMALTVALYGGDERITALMTTLLAVASGIALFVGMKQTFRRKRPCTLEPNCWTRLLPPDQFSFPSGHTITAFAVAFSLGGFYPAMRPGLFFCAASVAASRILLGMHYLTDVIVGVGIGWVLATFWAQMLA